MAVPHINHRHHDWKHLVDYHHDWKHLVDYETFWILMFSAVVIGSWIFAMLSIAQNNPQAFQ